MPFELIKDFDWSTPTDWTYTYDAEASGGTLTLTNPIQSLGPKNWAPVPATDGNGDAILADSIWHTIRGSGGPFVPDHGLLDLRISRNLQSGGKTIQIKIRGGGADQDTVVFQSGTGITLGSRYMDAGIETHFLNDGTWYTWLVRFIEEEIQFDHVRASDHRLSATDDTSGASSPITAGTVEIQQNDATTPVKVGGSGPSAQGVPIFAHWRHGSAELKESAAWAIPAGTVSLGRLSAIVSVSCATGYDPGTIDALPVALEYNLKHGGAWQGWTAVPADGDLSGVSITGGEDLIRVAVETGDGHGLDNRLDPRYVPIVHRIRLGYEDEAAGPVLTAHDCTGGRVGKLVGRFEG